VLTLPPADHRPWPLPARPWWGEQTWHSLTFLHWPVPANILKPLIPPGLELEEYGGTGWVAVTPFWMSGVTLRGVPVVPILSRFPELNTRTYVTRDGKPGVWFFSLDAGSFPAVLVARSLFHLPYFYARMRHRTENGRVYYRSERADGPGFVGWYAPKGDITRSKPGSLEHWLTERYCLYAKDQADVLYRAEIHHAPWPLQEAEVEIERNDLLAAVGIALTERPALAHFSGRLEVAIWSPEPVGSSESGLKR
jgi:uncharacterized protein YqjF (DUF2071 family)